MTTHPPLRALAAALALTATLLVSASPAAAFSKSSQVTVNRITYASKAESCNAYWSACSWKATVSMTAKRTFRHTARVRVSGLKVSLKLSADPEAGISLQSSTTGTATETGYATSNKISGVAKPGPFSAKVGARSELTSGAVRMNSGWSN